MLASRDRINLLHKVHNQKYDLIIIGGGITGAGIALESAARGYKTLLLEKSDFSAGTSSRSTKLIHGGLRYLKQLEFGLVMETGRERAVAHRIAPYLVHPQKMLLPIYVNGNLSKSATSLALLVYDKLAGVNDNESRKMLNHSETLLAEPLLLSNGLKGSGIYYEYQTDDARLTMEVIKTAAKFGAECYNYVEAKSFIYNDQKNISGISISDILSGNDYAVFADAVINATGPWVDKIRLLDEPIQGKTIHHTKGVHIVIDYNKLPIKQAIYFDVPQDKRMIFAIPRDGITYIGTTDTNYHADLEEPGITIEDVNYLIRAVNTVFNTSIAITDIQSSWSGLRPLIHEEGKSPSELSRKDELFISKSGLISIAGGKLTSYRKMAERVVKLCIKNKRISAPKLAINSSNIALVGTQSNTQPTATNHTLHQSLYRRYGTASNGIIQQANKIKSDDINCSYIIAELKYCLEHEAVINVSDFLVRRTGRLYFNIKEYLNYQNLIIRYMAEYFNWSEIVIQQQKSELEALYKLAHPEWINP